MTNIHNAVGNKFLIYQFLKGSVGQTGAFLYNIKIILFNQFLKCALGEMDVQ